MSVSRFHSASAAPHLGHDACEVTCPPLAAQPVRMLVPQRGDWTATEFGEAHFSNAVFLRQRARNAERLGEAVLAKFLRAQMRCAAFSALNLARSYRRNRT